MSWPHRLAGKSHSPISTKRFKSTRLCPNCGARINYCDKKKNRRNRVEYHCPECGVKLPPSFVNR